MHFFVALCLLAAVVDAISIPSTRPAVSTRRAGSGRTSARAVVDRDLARISRFNAEKSKTSARSFSVVATNEDTVYVVPVTLCGTVYYLIVDTGSANTWFGASTKVPATCDTSGGSHPFSISYGSGTVTGTERSGPITIGSVTFTQSFGVATSSSGFSGFDGVLGLGPVIETEGTVSGLTTVPTVFDNLHSQGFISTEAVGIYFHPENGSDTNDANGELTFGGPDTSKYSGTLTYFPLVTASPWSAYWSIAIASFSYGTTVLQSTASDAIVDTATTLYYIPTAAYNKFLTAAGGKTDASSGLARFSTKPTANFITTIGSVSYPLTPAQYLVPTAQYTYFGLSSAYYYSWINDGGSSGVNTIIGEKFLESYYSVFDVTNSRIGLAART
ncbi:acid protease [Clavulina sp. PMI_390]|nr:acid protease [Clavulina sp. PMI_390]